MTTTGTIEHEMIDSLVVLPRPPRQLQLLNRAIESILGNSKTVQSFINANVHGLLVRNQAPQFVVTTSDTVSDALSEEKMSQGCLFIPSTFDRVMIVKYVNNLSKVDSIDFVIRSIEHQLDNLSNVINEASGQLEKVPDQIAPVHLFICLPSKIKKSENFEKFQNSIDSMIKINSKLSNIKLSAVIIDEKALNKEITKSLKTLCSQKSNLICQLISFYDHELQQEQFYQLSSEECKFMNNQFSQIGQIDDVIQLFNFYFPNRSNELESIPHFNQLTDNMLYSYTDEGDPGKLPDYASYMGEVRLFSELLLSKLKNPSGILIKGFSNVQLNTIISTNSLQPQNFEIDWLYLGNMQIVAFEVGMSENPKEPKRPIQNKISQCLSKIIPQMQLILYSFWAAHQQQLNLELNNFDRVLDDVLRVIIFLPDVSFEAFDREIVSIRSSLYNHSRSSKKQRSDDFVADLHRNLHQVTKWVKFLVGGDKASDELKLFRITEDFQVLDSECSIDEIFRKDSSSENNLINYMSSLFSVASLNVVQLEHGNINKNALDVDQRYLPFFARWFNKKISGDDKKDTRDFADKVNFNLVLSPQQHRILSDASKTHLIITGQPGSGKTTLIIAKCEQMAELDNVDDILFLYDTKKYLFRNYLDRLIESNCSQIMNRKMKIHPINAGSDDLTPCLNRIENKSTTILMIDEIVLQSFRRKDSQWDVLCEFMCCWISLTENGNDYGIQNTLPPKFEHENLNILFRSASHISSISNSYIEHQPNTLPFLTKYVRIPGCFTAEQFEITARYVEKIEDALLVDRKGFLSDNFTGRLIVIISETDNVPTDFDFRELQLKWNAAELIHCTDDEEVDQVSGSEFQSVLIIIHKKSSYLFFTALTMAASRAQYELGLIVTGYSEISEQLSSYLSPVRRDYVLAFDNFIRDPENNNTWLEPTDNKTESWDWWQNRLQTHFSEQRTVTTQIVMRQSIAVRLQLTAAFPEFFLFPSEQPDDNGEETIVIVTEKEVNSLDNDTLLSLNLLYWSVISVNEQESVNIYLDILRNRSLLSQEINKCYPNATILHAALNSSDETLRTLFECSELKNSTILVKFQNQNAFELGLNHHGYQLFTALFSDPNRCDLFFKDYLEFTDSDCDEKLLEKYTKWGGEILFNAAIPPELETVALGIKILEKYKSILKYEFTRLKDGMTLVQYVVKEFWWCGDKRIRDVLKLLVEAGFPNQLLLHEDKGKDNVLDTIINNNYCHSFQFLLSDETRSQLFLSSGKKDNYWEYWQQQQNSVSGSDALNNNKTSCGSEE